MRRNPFVFARKRLRIIRRGGIVKMEGEVTMKRTRNFLWLLTVLMPVFVLTGCGSSPKDGLEGWVHFLAVPTSMPSGLATEPMLDDFEKFLCNTAGGFSRVGNDIGGYVSEGKVERESNYYYLVYSEKDLSRSLSKEIAVRFRQETPLVIATPAAWYAMKKEDR